MWTIANIVVALWMLTMGADDASRGHYGMAAVAFFLAFVNIGGALLAFI
jgi:hypothetical protein